MKQKNLIFFLSVGLIFHLGIVHAAPVKENLKQGDSLEFIYLDTLGDDAAKLIYKNRDSLVEYEAIDSAIQGSIAAQKTLANVKKALEKANEELKLANDALDDAKNAKEPKKVDIADKEKAVKNAAENLEKAKKAQDDAIKQNSKLSELKDRKLEHFKQLINYDANTNKQNPTPVEQEKIDLLKYKVKLVEEGEISAATFANGINLNGCSNIVATTLSNEPASGKYDDVTGYYVRLRAPYTAKIVNIPNKLFANIAPSIKTGCFDNLLKDDNTETYWMRREQINNVPHVEVGTTYGMLVVPYKWYTGGGSLREGSTVGAYLGYKSFFPKSYSSFAPIVALGYGKQKYEIKDATGVAKEYTGGVLTIAGGVIFGFAFDQFKIGVVYGRDMRRSASPDSPTFFGNWASVIFGWSLDTPSVNTGKEKTQEKAQDGSK